eukprot:TRINITY_DN624_c0_g1_i1.p1 TRINITY_DN624_c0_g1~~TRINITY_DN624_c0_g1_i1.p1  ORF type:complete len:216 (-),score=61.61 TRINITY_DN624_c0_g1_i1:133-780(-)
MPILYALIARGVGVLSDYTMHKGNFQQILASLLLKLEPNRKKIFKSEENTVYTYGCNGLTFVCLGDKDCKVDTAFYFLETVKDRLFAKYTDDQISNSVSGLNFDSELKTTMEEINADPNPDKAKAVIANLSIVKDQTAENLSKILERDIKINVVLAKTSTMRGIAVNYRRSSVAYKNAMCWRKHMCTIILVAVVLVAIWLVSSFICGFNYKKCFG